MCRLLASRIAALGLIAVSVVLLAAAPRRPHTAAEFAAHWGVPILQDPGTTVEPRCVCRGISHDGVSEEDGTLYNDGVFLQRDPGFTGTVNARLRVSNAGCECGVQPGYGRCIATARIDIGVPRGTRICLDHAGGVRWSCSPDGDCAPRYQCCVASQADIGSDATAKFELVENTFCGSSETAVFPVSRELIGPDCGVPADFRIADARFHWRCEACQGEGS